MGAIPDTLNRADNPPNKIALVTGAGSGIGRHTSMALAQHGFAVILVGRRRERLTETGAEIEAAGHAAHPKVCDITSPRDIGNLFDWVRDTFGRLDLLFNNAGTNVPMQSLEDISLEDWYKVLDVNVTGAFLCTRAAFALMRDQVPQGGRIINNGSVSAQVPRPGSAPYTTSKFAMTGLTRATALDGRKYNIACGQIDIGNARTEMATRMQEGILQADGRVAAEATMSVDHVAEAVVYMAKLPPTANVLSMTVMATQMPFVGRG